MATYRELKERAAAFNVLLQEARDVGSEAVLEDVRAGVKELGFTPFDVFGSPQDRRRRQSSKRARYRNTETGVEWSGFGRKPSGSKEKTEASSKSKRTSDL
jgi:DNA-binding protein H-NS